MGVAGLWDIIRPASQQRSIVHLSVHEGFLSTKHNKRGYRIGIDASIWFFHAHSSREGENPELRISVFGSTPTPALRLRWAKTTKVQKKQESYGRATPPATQLQGDDRGFRIRTSSGMRCLVDEDWGLRIVLQAPGEAEAELAFLNRIEVIDVILSDDVDNFLFGATLVMRNPSATLSGNRAHAIRNADGRDDGKHVVLFSAEKIREHLEVGLTHGGFILIGLLSGGDYDMRGLSKFGVKTAHALARAGLGDSLIRIFEYVSPEEMQSNQLPMVVQHALAAWRAEMRLYLSTDPDKLIGRKMKALANSIPEWFPPLDVLAAYLHPVTSESRGNIPAFHWAFQPSLKAITNLCERQYEWGVRTLIIKRFRTVIWEGAFIRVLRAAVMEGDEREADAARRVGTMFTPRSGRRTVDMAVGTPSRLINRTLSRMQIYSQERVVDPFSDDYVRPVDDEPLAIKIHSSRDHASTDHMLEYRLEIAPAQFVRMTEEGLTNLRREDPAFVANFGRRQMLLPEEMFEDDVGDDGTKKPEVSPNAHMRIWVPACILEMVHPALVEEYEEKVDAKARKAQEKIQRALDRAEGRASPKKSRAKTATPRSKKGKGKASNPDDEESAEDFTEAIADTPTKRKEKPANSRRFLRDNSSENEHDPTPKAKPKSKKAQLPSVGPMPASLLDVLNSSIPEIVGSQPKSSTSSSQQPKRPKKAQPRTEIGAPSKRPEASKAASTTAARQFLFSMKPDVLSDNDEEEVPEEELDPYAALTEALTSGSSRAPSRLQSATETSSRKATTSSQSRSASRSLPIGSNAARFTPDLRGTEPMEDFSHLFGDEISLPGFVHSASSSQSSQSTVAKRANRFIHDDEDEDEGSLTRKAPKRSTKQVSPTRQGRTVATRTNYFTSDSPPRMLSSAITKALNTASQTNPRAPKSSQQTKPAAEVIDLSDSDDDVQMISASQAFRSQPPSQPPKRATVTVVYKPQPEDVSIIDLD
ncbi:hypothetical protein FRC17_006912 [Serendipita sp. 399]|nr:hypothetical protein FRC17_006912 [Serendipita sp. 399]